MDRQHLLGEDLDMEEMQCLHFDPGGLLKLQPVHLEDHWYLGPDLDSSVERPRRAERGRKG